MTLKDFIVMCNNSNFVLNEDNGGDIAAKELADAWEHDADIIDEKNENTLLCQKIKRNIKNNHNKYCFLQNENLFIACK